MKDLICLTLFLLIFTTRVAHGHPLLKGSPASQIKQNEEADRVQLVRVANNVELEELVASGLIIQIPDIPGVRINERLPERFRFVRPWVVAFLTDLGKDFKERFGEEFQINSAIRTVEYQIHISKRNKNAAAVTGPKRSSHLTGAAIDIAKLPLTREQIVWLQVRLVALEKEKKIEATEEHHQAVFHIMVFPEYVAPLMQTASQ